MDQIRRFLKDEGGQVIVEYLILLSIVLGVFTVVFLNFRASLIRLWRSIVVIVRAPCPGCEPTGQGPGP